MKLVLERNREFFNQNETKKRGFGKKIGLIASLFGCWHRKLSRPFTIDKQSYRTCLKCGARKHFNTKTLETLEIFIFHRRFIIETSCYLKINSSLDKTLTIAVRSLSLVKGFARKSSTASSSLLA